MQGNQARAALSVVLLVLLLYMANNLATRDYRNEAKTLLRKVGREESADGLVPSSAKEASRARLTLEQQVQQLQKDMDSIKELHLENLVQEIESLKEDIRKDKAVYQSKLGSQEPARSENEDALQSEDTNWKSDEFEGQPVFSADGN